MKNKKIEEQYEEWASSYEYDKIEMFKKINISYEEFMKIFIELCSNGEVLMEEIDDFIDEWHESAQEIELHEFLGMSWKEYSAWVAEPDILPFIVTAYTENRPLKEILEEHESLPLAARADRPQKAMMILKWLKSEGKID